MKLIECVPNFSEGKNKDIINQITAEISSVSNVKLLDVDPVSTSKVNSEALTISVISPILAI